MREISLSQGLVALIDDADYPLVSAHKWCASLAEDRPAAMGGPTYYAKTHIRLEDGRDSMTSMHCFLMRAQRAPGLVVDHINYDGLRNGRGNLRMLTVAESNAHRRPFARCASPYKGVTWDSRRKIWIAHIYAGGHALYLGSSPIAEACALLYDRAALEMYGPTIAYLNFPPTTPSSPIAIARRLAA